MTKTDILSEIRRTAKENGGTPLGIERFRAETGIKTADWMGKFWARWGDAIVEAGYQPNQLQGPRTEDDLLGALASFVKELGRFPVANEIKLKARTEAGFPWSTTLAKFGGKLALATRLRDYSRKLGEADVASICDAVLLSAKLSAENSQQGAMGAATSLGYVYLMRHGTRHEFKIGKTNNPIRREGELTIELPEKLTPVHWIETDDPSGVERYWHSRFSDKRKNGEWFDLNADDVRAFKRWKRIY